MYAIAASQARPLEKDPMLKRLRLKFIALNMTTIFLVMVVAFVGICLTERQQNLEEVKEALGITIHKAAEADRASAAREGNGAQSVSAESTPPSNEEPFGTP